MILESPEQKPRTSKFILNYFENNHVPSSKSLIVDKLEPTIGLKNRLLVAPFLARSTPELPEHPHSIHHTQLHLMAVFAGERPCNIPPFFRSRQLLLMSLSVSSFGKPSISYNHLQVSELNPSLNDSFYSGAPFVWWSSVQSRLFYYYYYFFLGRRINPKTFHFGLWFLIRSSP